MMESGPRSPVKVSVEEILRLKRAERPAPEYWAEFESRLRHKQLAAIVVRRQWWRQLSVASIGRISIPVGATALVALAALVGMRQSGENSGGAGSSVASGTPESVIVANQGPGDSVDSKSAALQGTGLLAGGSTEKNTSSLAEGRSALAALSAAEHVNDAGGPSEPSLAQVILGLGNMTESESSSGYETPEPISLIPSMESIGRVVASPFSAVSVSPGSMMSSVRDDRRERLLASVESAEPSDAISGNSRVARTRDRIASRLTEQSLYDSISRLGLNGDSVSIKF